MHWFGRLLAGFAARLIFLQRNTLRTGSSSHASDGIVGSGWVSIGMKRSTKARTDNDSRGPAPRLLAASWPEAGRILFPDCGLVLSLRVLGANPSEELQYPACGLRPVFMTGAVCLSGDDGELRKEVAEDHKTGRNLEYSAATSFLKRRPDVAKA